MITIYEIPQPPDWQPWPEFYPYWQPGDRLLHMPTGKIGTVLGWASDRSEIDEIIAVMMVVNLDGDRAVVSPSVCFQEQAVTA